MTKWKTIKNLYIDNNLKIFPVVKNGKTPMIEQWQKDCSSDYFQILYWYENCKNCNWGLPASQNNIFILDLDVHDPNKNGVHNFDKILETLFSDEELDEIEFSFQVTPSGGQHLFFETDDDLRNVSNVSNAFKDYPGIDIRTDGYVVVEPSSINDKNYQFATSLQIKPMPKKLKEFILANANQKNSSKESKDSKEPYQKPDYVECGDRDNQLFNYINDLYFKTRLSYDEILLLANNFNENVLEKPFKEREVVYKVKKAFDKDRSGYIYIKLGSDE